jgi:hypothetical protein
MMNCFEARQDFPAFWRKTIAAERRAELLGHLAGCAKCDHAFRLFALSAPVLYGDRQAEHTPAVESREFSLLDRPRRFTPVPERIEQPRQWLRMSAAAAVLLRRIFFRAKFARYAGRCVVAAGRGFNIRSERGFVRSGNADQRERSCQLNPTCGSAY